MRRRTRARLLTFAALALLVLGWRFAGEPARRWLGLPADAGLPARTAESLRLVSWNLRNFPSEQHDQTLLARRFAELDADVLALQEVRNLAALEALLPGWASIESRSGGSGGQHVVIAYEPNRLELVDAHDHDDLTLGGRLRPALHAILRGRERGPDFHLVVVHLKARSEGLEQRRRQWPMLLAIAEEARRLGDEDLVVIGDFNAVGDATSSPADEIEAIAELFASTGLRRVRVDTGCTAYWDGSRHDAWKEPSELDLVWVRGLLESNAPRLEVRSAGPCARHDCASFRSTRHRPEPDFEWLSDHCPIALDLVAGDDDAGLEPVEAARQSASSSASSPLRR